MKKLALIFTLLLAVAVTGQAQTDTTKKAESTIWLYRLGANFGSAIKYSVYIDGEEAARIGNKRSIELKVKPGEHYFSTESNFRKDGMRLDIEPGQTYYLKFEIAEGNLAGRPKLIFVEPFTGKQEIQKVKPPKE